VTRQHDCVRIFGKESLIAIVVVLL
jgi:hypothetical protein